MPGVVGNNTDFDPPGGSKETKDGKIRLKQRLQKHYDMSAEQFLKVWGEHIHQGYFKSPTDTNEQAQINQVNQLIESSGITAGSRVLDVGCGIGGTARYLAREQGCKVTAITNSRRQVEMARELTVIAGVEKGSSSPPRPPTLDNTDFVLLPPSAPSTSISAGAGAVRVLNLDIEKMREHFSETLGETFDCIWFSEVIFHLHTRQLCFDSAFALLEPGGCLIIADMFAAQDPASSSKRALKELQSISRNHLCPQLSTVNEYMQMAQKAGFTPRHEPMDITKNVAKTWDTSLPILSVLYLISQGPDAIGYMRGMRSMKKAYAHGTATYAILCFEKPRGVINSETEADAEVSDL
ncbi:S-adenosyl-L-methionine-dependent methyltransferase [Periconia macrospinosa]|uniref:S-adenosyl-L-methionine-dependent methyltransferase n=1 Tax=Periconia macrospinosa TaxID=97972 RepID=A0A2V1D888_9PLEO|nr:S-adenosyl-L-methionine-dependent methyltransferase [Periconia macrospinosa]